MPKKLYLTSTDIEEASKKLVKKLRKLNFKKKKSLVVGIGRGGLIPAQYVAYGLGIRDITTLQSKLYKGDKIDTNQMEISGALLLDYDSYDTIFLIDDLVDTGTTINVVADVMEQMAEEFDTNITVIPAVLYTQQTKKTSQEEGIIYGKILKKDKKGKSIWVEFPWNTFIEGADS
jgi:hypoxanthine phosphoribosyltransferase